MKLPSIKKPTKTKPASRRTSNAGQNQSRSLYNYRSSRREADRPYNRGDQPKPKTPILARSYSRYATLVLALFALGYMLSLQPNANIKLSGQTVTARSDQSYKQAINQYLSRSILNYTKPTFNGDKLQSQLTAEFPEVSRVKVSLPLFSRQPKVEIVFAEPTLKLEVFGDDDYILGEQGRALAKDSEVSKALKDQPLTLVKDTSNQSIELGKTILTEQQLNFINITVDQAKQKKLKVEFVALAGSVSQINVKYAGVDYLVKYSFLADPWLSSGAYFATLGQLKRDNKTPKQYIDLRIPDRAYVK